MAATLALSGLAGAATGAMLATSGAADSVQFFTCTIGGKPVGGRFSKVWFENGDAVEIVSESQRDGSFAAYAIRRAEDRTLWMFPHCSRGGLAHWAFAIKMIPTITVAIALTMATFLGLAVWLLSKEEYPASFLWFMFWLNAVLSFVVGLYFPLKIGRKWRPFVTLAEKVFAALGYANPSRVDMVKQNSQYWKKHAKPGEQRRVAPWVFRYVDKSQAVACGDAMRSVASTWQRSGFSFGVPRSRWPGGGDLHSSRVAGHLLLELTVMHWRSGAISAPSGRSA